DGVRLRVPRGVSVYGLALVRLSGSPEPDIVAFTDDYRLTAWTARGQRLWTSSDPLGGSAITFEFNPTGGARRQAGEDNFVARVAGRVVPVPGTAAPEVLVYENLLPALQQGRGILPRLAATLFDRGRVHRLRWRDGAFVRVWQSGTTEGYIADFGYGDLDGDGIPEVVVGVVPRGFDVETLSPFGRPRGRIVAYELP
ncbi:MAG: FG-GAP repeat domain-containing protein, partial [Candidatus Rokuibacteriota bacterium]